MREIATIEPLGGDDMELVGVAVFAVVLLLGLSVIVTFVVLGIVLIKALIRYIRSKDVRKEKAEIKRSLGEVLKQHREECKMTQEFVAESVGVSRQAVSKWEHNLAEPDLSTIKKISYIFKISIDDFLDIDHKDGNNGENVAEDRPDESGTTEVSEQIVTAVENAVKQNQIAPIGYCVSCGSIVTKENAGIIAPKVLCKKCYEEKLANDKVLAEKRQKNIDAKVKDVRKKKRKSIVWGSIVSVILLIFNIMAMASGEFNDDLAYFIPFTIFMVYAAFAFVSEVILDEGPIPEILVWFVTRPIKLPGIIFTLDLGGLAFLIVAKIGFAILGFLLGVILFLIGVGIGIIVAPFSYPFTITRINKEIKQIKNSTGETI